MELINSGHNSINAYVVKQGYVYIIKNESEFSKEIRFQSGSVLEHGANGVTNEALISILINRINYLNTQFPCFENEVAVIGLETALHALTNRTKDRLQRGVEGANKL